MGIGGECTRLIRAGLGRQPRGFEGRRVEEALVQCDQAFAHAISQPRLDSSFVAGMSPGFRAMVSLDSEAHLASPSRAWEG